MSKEATREYVVRTRIRYEAMTGKRAKGRVLDEFCATTGMERKHAIKVLRAPGDPPERRGRKPTYGTEESHALRAMWMEAGQPCSKLMKPVMDCYVQSHELAHGAFGEALKEKLLKISESSIDRLLKPAGWSLGPGGIGRPEWPPCAAKFRSGQGNGRWPNRDGSKPTRWPTAEAAWPETSFGR